MNRTRKKVWGKERTIVIAVSEVLRAGQTHGLDQALAKKQEELGELKAELRSPRAKKYNKDELQQKVAQLVKGEKCPLILKVNVLDTEDGGLDLAWQIDQASYEWVTKEFYGKRILVTCRDDSSNEEIIAAYHGQSQVERVFKQLKDPHHHAVRPQYHWTDQKIKVHTFLCLVGLLKSLIVLGLTAIFLQII